MHECTKVRVVDVSCWQGLPECQSWGWWLREGGTALEKLSMEMRGKRRRGSPGPLHPGLLLLCREQEYKPNGHAILHHSRARIDCCRPSHLPVWAQTVVIHHNIPD